MPTPPPPEPPPARWSDDDDKTHDWFIWGVERIAWAVCGYLLITLIARAVNAVKACVV